MSTTPNNKELYTARQLSLLFSMSKHTVQKILTLTSLTPDGKKGRYPGYYADTFENAKNEYYSSEVEDDDLSYADSDVDIDGQISEADLRIKRARAEALEIQNAERKNTLVSRKSAEDFLHFVVQLFADKLREVTREDNRDELYNTMITDAYQEIESYINDKGFEYMIDEKAVKKTGKILNECKADTTEYQI